MTDTVRETKRVNELKPGDWIAAGPYNDQPDGTDDAEVLHVHPYADGRRVAVTIQEVTIPEPAIIHLFADGQVTLLTAEDIAEHRAEDQRAQRIANLRELADWLEANPWAPTPNHFDASAHLDDPLYTPVDAYAKVREVAARLGVEPEERLDDRTVVGKGFGRVVYKVIAWHQDGRPAEPAPVPSGAVADEREGPWFEVGDRVTFHGWEKSQYFRAGLNVVGTVVETKPIAGSSPARQQFRAEGADWCGGGGMWNHSDNYELAPADAPASAE